MELHNLMTEKEGNQVAIVAGDNPSHFLSVGSDSRARWEP